MYEYAGVPPVGTAVTVPVLPEHPVGVLVAVTKSLTGCEIVTGADEAVQPFASTTVYVSVPAEIPHIGPVPK